MAAQARGISRIGLLPPWRNPDRYVPSATTNAATVTTTRNATDPGIVMV
ncbi:hypothetical protein ACFQQB_64815 [Nonomuraea rubra]